MSNSIKARKSTYDGQIYIDCSIDVNSDAPRELFAKMSRTAIKWASDLMYADEQTPESRKLAIEYLGIAADIETMLDELAMLQKEDKDAVDEET